MTNTAGVMSGVRRRSVHLLTLRVGAVLLTVLALSGTATAQGRGRGVGKGGVGLPAPSVGQTSTGSTVLQAVPAFPQFGTWLDDASTVAEGAGYASIGTTYWRGSLANQLNAPILSATYGITNRAQLSATLPFYRLRSAAYSGSGVENIYIHGKFGLITSDASDGGFGVALGAVAEILSAAFAEGSRAHWAVPVSVEFRGGGVRLYGSTGYFSRGAFFAGGAFEWTAPMGTSVTASLGHSQSVKGVTMATSAPLQGSALRDASLFVSHPVSNGASVYVAASRTFSTTTLIDGGSSLGGGVSFRFAGR